MELRRRETGRSEGPPHGRSPGLWTAHEDVALGDVGHPREQRPEVVTVTDAAAEPRVGTAAVPSELYDVQPALPRQPVQLGGEEGVLGEALEEDCVAS